MFLKCVKNEEKNRMKWKENRMNRLAYLLTLQNLEPVGGEEGSRLKWTFRKKMISLSK